MKMRWMLALLFVACSSERETADSSTPDGAIADTTTQDTAMPDAPITDSGKPLGEPRIFVGSGDGNIRVYAFDTQSPYAIKPIDQIATNGNPSFLAFDPAMSFVYAVDEKNALVHTFVITPKVGKLTSLGSVSSRGAGPAHVFVDRAGKLVMAANYSGGTIALFPRLQDGRLADASATRSFGNNAQTHQIVTDPTNAFVLVPNKGLDNVAVFRLLDGGSLVDLGATPAGDGARHIAFDPAGTHAYVIDENSSMVTAMTFDPQSGALAQIQSISSLMDGSAGPNTGAEIEVTKDGKHVIASNRGDDSLSVFDIDQAGKLVFKARVSTLGNTPRHFSIDETGQWLVVGNQTSGTLVVMKIDAQTGIPAAVGAPFNVPQPEWTGLVYLP
jgi:6-phosphogluconolactonase